MKIRLELWSKWVDGEYVRGMRWGVSWCEWNESGCEGYVRMVEESAVMRGSAVNAGMVRDESLF